MIQSPSVNRALFRSAGSNPLTSKTWHRIYLSTTLRHCNISLTSEPKLINTAVKFILILLIISIFVFYLHLLYSVAHCLIVHIVNISDFGFYRCVLVAAITITSTAERQRDESAILRGWVTFMLNFRLKTYVLRQYLWMLDRGMVILRRCRWKFSHNETL